MEKRQEKWLEIRKGGDFAGIAKQFGIDPVIARMLRCPDIVVPVELERYLQDGRGDLHDPHLLKDAVAAAGILAEKIRQGSRIRIIGDYDIDGVSATYILLEGLTRCGAQVDAAIPDRMKDGYGINENLIALAAEAGVDTIITCDNGIAAIDAIHVAKEAGMTVIVTDHHDIPYRMEGQAREYLSSEADAVINPKQNDCPYPYKELCGAAVAWKFLQVLYEKMGIPAEEADVFLENVGFATVGDVMDLTGENRILVKLGLAALQHTGNPGMRALIAQNQLMGKHISAYHIGFVLGPCINASGRLDTARRSLELLREKDSVRAAALAGELIELNNSRKDMTFRELERALEKVENGGCGDKVLVVYLPECHESLAGIIAGRIREQYYRPVFVLTMGEEGVKGSGRSIEEYSMFDEMTKVSELFTKYGGHPMAAGLSMPEEHVEPFRRRLNELAALTQEDLAEKIHIDVALPLSYLTPEFIGQLRLLEPCGKGNVKPVFADKGLAITRAFLTGKNRNVLRLMLRGADGVMTDGVYFGKTEEFLQYFRERFGEGEVEAALEGRENAIRFAAIYEPTINDYNGRNTVQVIIRKYC
ncbi:MAG: single-stranded-DNA-specific exonuclease RecJ [Lachnospiraceae bacterium]|nr:single-stranded-DNA-specific exonuclease RecJ [Lachnospiraceae bacterium]